MGEGWCRAQWGLLGLLPKEGKEDSKLSKGSLVDRWQMCKDNAREPVGNKVTSVGVGLDDVREGSRTQDTSYFGCEDRGLVAGSCLTLCNPMDCSPPGFPVHGILQAKILEWLAIPFSRRTSQPNI